jgi:uncharacterized protein
METISGGDRDNEKREREREREREKEDSNGIERLLENRMDQMSSFLE